MDSGFTIYGFEIKVKGEGFDVKDIEFRVKCVYTD